MKYINKYIIKFASILIILLFLCSCEKIDFHGTGKIITEIRYIDNFNSLDIDGNVEIILFFSSSESERIEITGGKKLLPDIETYVIDSTLFISNKNRMNWLRSYKKSKILIRMYTDSIKKIYFSGTGDITFSNTLNINSFMFETNQGTGNIKLKLYCDTSKIIVHTGALNITAEGYSENFMHYSHAHGVTYTLGLISHHATVDLHSTSECYVAPVKTLGVNIHYIGNVYYKNEPEILWLFENHKGRLIKID